MFIVDMVVRWPANATTSIQNFDFQTLFGTTPYLQTRFTDYPRPSNLIHRLPPTFKPDSQTPSDIQTRFADLHAPTFKLDSQTFMLRLSNSICRPSLSDIHSSTYVYYFLDHVTDFPCQLVCSANTAREDGNHLSFLHA